MNLMWWFYLVNVVGNFGWYFCGLTCICLFGIIACSIGASDMNANSDWKTWRMWFTTFIFCGAFSLLFSLATPSEKTMYLMLGSKAAQEIVDNPAVKEVGGRLLKVVNKKLDELMPEEEKKPIEAKAEKEKGK